MKVGSFSFSIIIFLLFIIKTALGAGIDMKVEKLLKAGEGLEATYLLRRNGYYFTTLYFLEREELDPQYIKTVESIIFHTGVQGLYDQKISNLKKLQTSGIFYIIGKKFFDHGRYKKAIHWLEKIYSGHRFSHEAKLLEGLSHTALGNKSEALTAYEHCMAYAGTLANDAKTLSGKRFHTVVKETCITNIARIHYEEGKFEKALESWDEIPKKSYRWPYLLLEKAWAFYYRQNYNRTLGVLVTYKSPLLESYFDPEIEVLIAQSYFKLCLWDDSLEVINYYFKEYQKLSTQISAKIATFHRPSDYVKLTLTPLSKLEKENRLFRNLVTKITKTNKFKIDMAAIKRINKEIGRVEKWESELKEDIGHVLKGMRRHRVQKLSHYIKKFIFDFINRTHALSSDLLNIRLEILSKKRGLLYDQKKLIADRSRGNFENVNRKTSQFFFKFNGEFWTDEFGDYSFGLMSNCETVDDKLPRKVQKESADVLSEERELEPKAVSEELKVEEAIDSPDDISESEKKSLLAEEEKEANDQILELQNDNSTKSDQPAVFNDDNTLAKPEVPLTGLEGGR